MTNSSPVMVDSASQGPFTLRPLLDLSQSEKPGIFVTSVIIVSDESGGISADALFPSSAQIYVGTSQGQVLRYHWTPHANTAIDDGMLMICARVALGRKAVDQLCMLPEVDRLAVLSGGHMYLVDPTTLQSPASVPQARGACLMARESSTSPQLSDEGSVHSIRLKQRQRNRCQLAVVSPRKLFLLEFRAAPDSTAGGSSFSSVAVALVQDWPSLAGVESLAWLDSSLLLATSRQYFVLSLKNDGSCPSLHLFSLPPDSPQRALVKALPPSHEALLLADGVGVVVDSHGQPCGAGSTLPFSHGRVAALAHSPPYIVAALEGVGQGQQLGVYHRLGEWGRAQILELGTVGGGGKGRAGGVVLAETEAGEVVVVAKGGQLWELERIPIIFRVRELLRLRKYDQALSLAEEVQPGEARLRSNPMLPRVEEAHTQAGLLLLADIRFEEAFAHLRHSRTLQPMELFPMVPELSARWRSMIPLKRHWGLHPPLQSLSEMIRLAQKRVKAGQLKPPPVHLDSLPQSQEDSWTGRKEEALLMHVALKSLSEFLREFRGTRRHEMSDLEKEAVDTVLLLLLLKLNDPVAMAQLQTLVSSEDCSCVVEEVEAALRERKKFGALAMVEERQGRLDKALEVWSEMAQGKLEEGKDKEEPMEAMEAGSDQQERAVREVRRLLESCADAQLALRHSIWMMDVDADVALEVLTSPNPSIPPDSVLRILPQLPLQMSLRYLQWLVENKQSEEVWHHTLYAKYLKDAVVGSQGRNEEGKVEERAATRISLQTFLKSSSFYDTQAVLAHLQGADLWKETSIVLRRRGEHLAALRILALKLRDCEAAEQYCADLGTPESFAQLMDLYLHPGKDVPPLVDAAVRLLYCHRAQLDPVQVMQVLPESKTLMETSEKLVYMMMERLHRRRQGQITRELSRAINLAARMERVQEHSRHVLVTEDTKCGLCSSRIGTKLFGLYPHGIVACYQCLQQTG